MRRPLFDLTDKTAFITGATKGIGRAIAEAFADHGARLALTSRHRDEAEAAAAEINQSVGREAAIGLEADLYARATSISAYDQAVAHFGRIDVLVCNAAATPHDFGPAASFPLDEYSSLLEANVVNNMALINHAVGAMKERRDGVVIATSSAAGLRPSYGVFPYGVAKAALNHAIRSLGAELAPFNVRVNAVAPGLTRSWSVEQVMKENPQAIEMFKSGVPLHRLVEAEEVAAGVVFLASEGGKAITGHVIPIDGGEPGAGAAPTH